MLTLIIGLKLGICLGSSFGVNLGLIIGVSLEGLLDDKKNSMGWDCVLAWVLA